MTWPMKTIKKKNMKLAYTKLRKLTIVTISKIGDEELLDSELVHEATRPSEEKLQGRGTPHQEELRNRFNIPRTMERSDSIVILPLAKITGGML